MDLTDDFSEPSSRTKQSQKTSNHGSRIHKLNKIANAIGGDYSTKSAIQKKPRGDNVSRHSSAGQSANFGRPKMSQNSMISGKSRVTFDYGEKPSKLVADLDLRLESDQDDILQTRKIRFETLQKYQKAMENPRKIETPGKAFLESIQEKLEAERQKKLDEGDNFY